MFGWFGFGDDKSKSLSAGELRDLLREKDGAIVVIDVREDQEWAGGHIAGAVHAPLSRFAEAMAKIPTGKKVVFYCQSGMRSRSAIGAARKMGYEPHGHLAGGLPDWRRHDFPIVR
jgi:rhodanese-related sulfurtransferase